MSLDRQELILKHLPQVRWIAANIHERLPSSISEEDLVSTGIVGLIQAIDNFDPAREVSLRTYAEFRIRGAILDSVRGLDGLDPKRRKRARTVQKAIAGLEQRLGRTASDEEIAGELGVPVEQYFEWLSELRGVCIGSLSGLGPDGDDGPLRYTADETQEDPSVNVERNQMRQLLAEGIRGLPQTERIVIDLYFGKELTLAEIGRVLGVHLSRAAQLKVQAILRLRNYLNFRLKTPKAAAHAH